jgi:transcription termination factor NusB
MQNLNEFIKEAMEKIENNVFCESAEYVSRYWEEVKDRINDELKSSLRQAAELTIAAGKVGKAPIDCYPDDEEGRKCLHENRLFNAAITEQENKIKDFLASKVSECCNAEIVEVEDDEKNYYDCCSKCRKLIVPPAPKEKEPVPSSPNKTIEEFTETFKDDFAGGDMWNWERAEEVIIPWLTQVLKEKDKEIAESHAAGVEEERQKIQKVMDEIIASWRDPEFDFEMHEALVKYTRDSFNKILESLGSN